VVKGSITRALSYLLLVCDELLVYEGLKLLVYEALLRLYQGSIKALSRLYEGSIKALVRL
jgi:hypothetical protein